MVSGAAVAAAAGGSGVVALVVPDGAGPCAFGSIGAAVALEASGARFFAAPRSAGVVADVEAGVRGSVVPAPAGDLIGAALVDAGAAPTGAGVALSPGASVVELTCGADDVGSLDSVSTLPVGVVMSAAGPRSIVSVGAVACGPHPAVSAATEMQITLLTLDDLSTRTCTSWDGRDRSWEPSTGVADT